MPTSGRPEGDSMAWGQSIELGARCSGVVGSCVMLDKALNFSEHCSTLKNERVPLTIRSYCDP